MDGMPYAQPSRTRTHLLWVAFIGLLLLGLVALNAPITFAQTTTSPTTQVAATDPTSGLPTSSSSATLLDASVETVAKSANPAVVTITNLQAQTNPRTGAQSPSLQPVDSGSGYIISADGYVVTNSHVVAGGQSFQVQFMDGTTADATLVGADSVQDVAVLKLDLKNGQKVPGFLSFGDSMLVL